MKTDQYLPSFIAEAQEMLNTLEAGLLRAEAGDCDADGVAALFRAMHTLKGSAGLLGLPELVGFSHRCENVLERARAGRIALEPELAGVLLACRDHLAQRVAALAAGAPADPDLDRAGERLLARLAPWLAEAVVPSAAPATAPGAPVRSWRITLRLNPDALRNGMDPASFLRYLETLGRIVQLETSYADLPGETEYQPLRLYLNFELVLETEVSRQRLEDVFTFVREDSDIQILALADTGPVGASLDSPPATPPHAPYGIRVLPQRLDQLVNLVGELITTRQRIDTLVSASRDPVLREALSGMGLLTEQIRDATLKLRMVPIAESFLRFRRIVRDVAQELGKSIQLVIRGGETELDRALVERIGDPLTHLVRNAIDHGIEPSEQRTRAGKPAAGQLSLNAYQEAGGILIEIADDGAGLDPVRIRAKALALGLIAPEEALDEAALHQLIFSPGISTAPSVTELSGRGVGLDVVKRGIEALQGGIEVESAPGRGTVFRIRLPLTLAIIDGFHVSVDGVSLILPMDLVQECMDLEPLGKLAGENCVVLRDELLPCLRLDALFALGQTLRAREKLVVVQFGSLRAGLVVDALYGELQAVVKPLGPLFASLHGIGGSTVLGSGEIAFVLDVPHLIQFAARPDQHLARASRRQELPL